MSGVLLVCVACGRIIRLINQCVVVMVLLVIHRFSMGVYVVVASDLWVTFKTQTMIKFTH